MASLINLAHWMAAEVCRTVGKRVGTEELSLEAPQAGQVDFDLGLDALALV